MLGLWQFAAAAAGFAVAAAAVAAIALRARRSGDPALPRDPRSVGYALLAVASIVLGALAMSTPIATA